MIYLNKWIELTISCMNDLFCFYKISYISFFIHTAGVKTTTISMNTSSGNKSEWERCFLNCYKRNNLHITKNGNGNQIFENKVFEGDKVLNNRIIKLIRWFLKPKHTINSVSIVVGNWRFSSERGFANVSMNSKIIIEYNTLDSFC